MDFDVGSYQVMSKPIDYRALEEMYNDLTSPLPRCEHPNAVSVDKHGVYHLNCNECGLSGATNEEGARYLGWIQ